MGFPANTSFNRFDAKSEDALGTLGEFEPLQLEVTEYMSCGDAATPGVLRCRQARDCRMAWKGVEGTQKVVAIDGEHKVVKDAAGNPQLIDHAAGGPKNICVWRKDGSTGQAKTQVMSCIRFLDDHPRWKLNNDLVRIRAVEGDGREVEMKESKEKVVLGPDGHPQLDASGRKRLAVERVVVKRAVPFHLRPHEVLKDRVSEVAIEGDIKQREHDELWGDIGGVPVPTHSVDLKGSSRGSVGTKATPS